MNLFAIVDGIERTVRRIRIERALQDQLRTEFEVQREAFFADAEIIDFNPRYKVDDDELFVVRDYELPEFISTAICDINQINDLHLTSGVHIKAIFAADCTPQGDDRIRVYFQGFMRQQLLVNNWTLFGNGRTYRKMEDPGVTLASSLAAFYDADIGLFFRSYTLVSRFLNLESYFIEAADEDIRCVLGDDKFEVEDVQNLINNSDSIMRKRIMAVLTTGILDRVTVKKIKGQAHKFGVDIQTQNGKIVFPTDRKKAKELLRLLLEGYYDGPLTGTKYVTNSQRPLPD